MEVTLGKRIVANRKKLGMTQDQLAEKMGITAQAVSKWENDQSCPDISALPQLADIFGITVDALLGRENAKEPAGKESKKAPVFEAVVVDDKEEDDGHHLEFRFGGGRKSYIGAAIWAIAVGAFYLASLLCGWQLPFWKVLWPTTLLIFGLFHLFYKSIFLSLSCILIGSYQIACYFLPKPVMQDNRIIWAAIIILVGISLLVNGIRKKKKSHRYIPTFNYHADRKFSKSLNLDEDSFDYDAAFGSDRVCVDLPSLQIGDIDVSFGDYYIDLRGVEAIDKDCQLDVDISFGELTILIPSRFVVKMNQDTTFSGMVIKGQPDEAPEGIIFMNANVSFGSLVIEYV